MVTYVTKNGENMTITDLLYVLYSQSHYYKNYRKIDKIRKKILRENKRVAVL